MSRQIRLLFGISVFWLALSVLLDGVNPLVLPLQIGAVVSRQQIGTGSLWRIRRTDGPQGLVPPKPTAVPVYLLQGLALLAGVVGGALISARLFGKLRGNGNGRHK